MSHHTSSADATGSTSPPPRGGRRASSQLVSSSSNASSQRPGRRVSYPAHGGYAQPQAALSAALGGGGTRTASTGQLDVLRNLYRPATHSLPIATSNSLPLGGRGAQTTPIVSGSTGPSNNSTVLARQVTNRHMSRMGSDQLSVLRCVCAQQERGLCLAGGGGFVRCWAWTTNVHTTGACS